MNNNVITSNHSLINANLNYVISSQPGVNIVHPFIYKSEGNRIAGVFTLSGGYETCWEYSGEGKSLEQVEREINLDLAKLFFNNAISRGFIKTNHLFTILHTNFSHPATALIAESKEGFFSQYAIMKIQIENEDSEQSIYDFATGRLNVRLLDQKVDLAPKIPGIAEPLNFMDQIYGKFGEKYQTMFQLTGQKQIESGVEMIDCQEVEFTEQIQLPKVDLIGNKVI